MDSAERILVLKSIADRLADYRHGEIPKFTPETVDRWVSQFPGPSQAPILAEVDYLFERSYFSRAKVEEFLGGLLKPNRLVGDDPGQFWKATGILNIQREGHSQRDMLAIFDRLMQQNCRLSLYECRPSVGRFVYIDDGLFSGQRFKNDIIPWLDGAPDKAAIYVVSIAQHTGSIPFARKMISAVARQLKKTVSIEGWRCIEIENRLSERDRSEVFWPARIPDDELTIGYVKTLTEAGFPPILRRAGGLKESKFFSGEHGRDLLEQEFLIAGARIRRDCWRLHEYQRPLGNSVLRTLGFGATLVTFRNCPNSCPLAFWASDPWVPLFQRRTN